MSFSSLRTVESCDHEIAPNGDAVLVLKNPNAPFAVWDDPAAPASASIKDKSRSSASSITFLVSSHHLQSASSVFRAAFTGPWVESSRTKDGRHQITAEDWDVEALLVILNIVHGRNYDVSKTVTLELLCKISVLVDYYHLSEAVRFISWFWLDGLRASIPKTYGRELVLWLCVSWILGSNSIFQAVTDSAIRESSESVSALQLPISAVVIDEINKRREKALAAMAGFLENLGTGFIEGTIGCTSECQSIMLGALMKNMVAQGILEGGRGCQFQEMSVSKAVQAARTIKSPDIEWRSKSGRWHQCSFSLSDAVRDFARGVTNDIKPLELDEFKSTTPC